MILEINRSKTRQRIIGFGGAFTDAAGINIASLPEGAQKNLMAAYFSAQGKIFVKFKIKSMALFI